MKKTTSAKPKKPAAKKAATPKKSILEMYVFDDKWWESTDGRYQLGDNTTTLVDKHLRSKTWTAYSRNSPTKTGTKKEAIAEIEKRSNQKVHLNKKGVRPPR